MTEMKRTPLHEQHVVLGGKMVPFAGFQMPVQYPRGISAEHRAVREAAGLFDVSHMGEFEVRGADDLALIQRVTVNDASRLEVWQAQYSALCREDGGILDDLLVYRFPEHYLLVVNASNRGKDLACFRDAASSLDVEVVDRSDEMALIALQGPRARAILSPLLDGVEGGADAIGYYRFALGRVAGADAIISGTGYTGEDGFELYIGAEDAVQVWMALIEAGESHGLVPAGLGARDSLRLEVGFALYGNDLDEDHTPLESRLGWIVKLDKGDFIGRAALAAQKEAGVTQRLVGLRLTARGFPRAGYPILSAKGEVVGAVRSGIVSPTLGYGIAMGFVSAEHAGKGTEVAVEIRGKAIPAVIQPPPFYTEGSIRR